MQTRRRAGRSVIRAQADVVGRCAIVTAYSDIGAGWAPVDQVTWFSLFPDVLHGARGPHVVERLAVVKTPLCPSPLAKSHLVIRSQSVRWWDEDVLNRRASASSSPASLRLDADMFRRLRGQSDKPSSGLDDDLPIYVNRSTARSMSLDWTALEFDVFRGVNGEIPFTFKLEGKLREDQERIERERPFLDVTQHFRPSVSDEAVMELSRQLFRQYTVKVGAAMLTPARWWAYVSPGTTVLAKTGEFHRLTIVDARHADLRVGMIDVDMRKPALPRESPADAGERATFTMK